MESLRHNLDVKAVLWKKQFKDEARIVDYQSIQEINNSIETFVLFHGWTNDAYSSYNVDIKNGKYS